MDTMHEAWADTHYDRSHGPTSTLFYRSKDRADATTLLLSLAKPLFVEVMACVNEGRTNPQNVRAWESLRNAVTYCMRGD